MKTEILFHVGAAAEVWLQTPLIFEVVPGVSADMLPSPNVNVPKFFLGSLRTGDPITV